MFLFFRYSIFVVAFSSRSLRVSRGLDALSGKNKSANPPSLPMDTVVLSLQDLIFYFRPPEEELEHEDKQFKLRSLKNRQNLFQEEVGLTTVFMKMYNSCMFGYKFSLVDLFPFSICISVLYKFLLFLTGNDYSCPGLC